MQDTHADKLIEVSWEVCNKVGGIYTVVMSKVGPIIDHYGHDNYLLIGPYFADRVRGEFESIPPPEPIKQVIERLHEEGIHCYYGKWLINGNPKTLLIDSRSYFDMQRSNIKAGLWERYGIDSMNSGYDFDEPVVWSTAVGRFIDLYAKALKNQKVVAQFHEWLSGAAILHLKDTGSKVATVFTTHATMLGRTLASRDIDIYTNIKEIDANKASYECGMHYKQQMEKACAQTSGSFTTVSAITGLEAEHFLGRKPDVLLLNGLDINKFPTFEESSLKHHLFKTKIKEFLMSYFFPYYSFDLSKTLHYFVCGRNEFHVKGIDLTIDSLAQLNQQLKDENSDRHVVCFFFVPGNIRGIKNELVENKTYFNDIKESMLDNLHDIQLNLLRNYVAQRDISAENLFGEEMAQSMQKKLRKLLRQGNLPPLCTHDLYEEEHDQIISNLRSKGLLNRPEDRVKVIYYPIFLSGADGLLNTSYYETMHGCHLGIFPSYYEPWGYTPLECSSLGVASVTSDLAGFGKYIENHLQEKNEPGIYLIKRLQTEWNEQVEQLTKVMKSFYKLSPAQRIENRITAKRLADICDWNRFVENYVEAHNQAVDKSYN